MLSLFNKNAHDYDLVVIGAGSGGMTAAVGAATLGAKTLLIEKHKIGGDCTNYGCVPSKTLIKAADIVRTMRSASSYGLPHQDIGDIEIRKVLEHVQSTISYFHTEIESVEQIEQYGVDVELGAASFVSDHEVVVNGKTVSARRFIIATGGTPRVADIQGMDEIEYMTNESVFKPQDLRSLVIYGSGPIGCELGQAFNQLGVDVTIVNRTDGILGKEDKEAADLIYDAMKSEGVTFKMPYTVETLQKLDEGIEVTIKHTSQENDVQTLQTDGFLFAIGRVPNVDNIGLEQAGVAFSDRGIQVNEKLQTSRAHIYAVGDVIGGLQFTHLADSHGKTALTNAFFGNFVKHETNVIPRSTFTYPEVAAVGLTEDQLKESKAKYLLLRKGYDEIDKAVTDGQRDGFMKIMTTPGGKILGATIVGEHAGEVIGYIAFLMKNDKKVTSIADVILPYPTVSFGLGKTANLYRQKTFSEWQKRLLKIVLGLRG